MSYKHLTVRVISVFLALSLMISMGTTAFAADDECITACNALSIDSNLWNGSSGESVWTLQTMLNRFIEKPIVVDGFYGSNTQQAVSSFQRMFGLEVTGSVNDSTRERLNSEFLKEASKQKVVVRVHSYLNVRSGPDVEYPEIGKTYNGDIYTVLGESNGWYMVEFGEDIGWIKASYTKNTFVAINIPHQYLVYYINGCEVLFCAVVTGANTYGGTPEGVYTLDYMSRDTKLMNDAFVKYWMNFQTARGIGMHDASWRNKFGGEIYKYGGSHNCVNMPEQDAEFLYNHITLKTTIVIQG